MKNNITSILPNNSFSPINIFNGRTIAFRGAKKILPDKGNLVYEYNPLRNYRLDYDLYEYDELGRIGDTDVTPFTQAQLIVKSPRNAEIFNRKLTISNIYVMLSNNEVYNTLLNWNRDHDGGDVYDNVEEWNFLNYQGEWSNISMHADDITLFLLRWLARSPSKGTLVVTSRANALLDFDTELLLFSLKNPVGIETQPSYDGSVNLIINDDKNFPKLINSRFSTMEDDTYLITDHTGNNDTNIYDRLAFDLETNLYKLTSSIAQVRFVGLKTGGNNKCGSYNYYFKFSDVDGNETDFIAETRNVVCHVGNPSDPFSVRGGLRDENSGKSVIFLLSNLDRSYDYVIAYFTRHASDEHGTPVTFAGKINRQFLIKNGMCEVVITGFEDVEDKTIDDINHRFEVVSSAKSVAQAQNMLFLGNVNKPEIPYKELSDLALRIFPVPYMKYSIGAVNENYQDVTGKYEYYNAKNIYDYTSYWEREIYRFGVVFILENYTLTPVFNIRGAADIRLDTDNADAILKDTYTEAHAPLYDESKNRVYIQTEDNLIKGGNPLENDKGVVRFKTNKSIIQGQTVTPIGVKFYIDWQVVSEIKKYCKGIMFVRQKRIPTILAQALVIGVDRHSFVPLLPVARGSTTDVLYMTERFITNDKVLSHDFEQRAFYQAPAKVSTNAALCPEAELRSTVYTLLFTGEELMTIEALNQPNEKTFLSGAVHGVRHKVLTGYVENPKDTEQYEAAKITMVEDNILLKTSTTQKYAARAGSAEEAWRVGYLGDNNIINVNATNLVRGSFGAYIGLEGKYEGALIVNIYISGYDKNEIPEYFKVRYDDVSPYTPVSNRIDLDNEVWYNKDSKTVSYLTYGGDCYTALVTHRMIRNFLDPETPINDTIIDADTWKKNYDPEDEEKYDKINRGDVNAIKIGHWATFKILSNININFRDLDLSWNTEIGLTGVPRGFFPLQPMTIEGNYKVPESNLINGGVSSSTSERYNFVYPNVPWIKNQFDTRIIYSDVHVTDAFKNGYRVFGEQNHRDYTKNYGTITKILEWAGNLICVCEHGVLLIPVNERVLAGDGSGGSVYINTKNVLPENPLVISSTYGSTWIESVIKTDHYIYGVDTIGKKIWRTEGKQLEVISDFKVQKFLNDNITLKEREKVPLIGVRNVKTHFNPYKMDIMFTFYDNLYGEEEKVWNICYNEILSKWITFYSWVPSYSEAINNIYFSFDRTTSKFITKLGVSNENSEDADGICLSDCIFTDKTLEATHTDLRLYKRKVNGRWATTPETTGIIGKLNLKNRNLPSANGVFLTYLDFELLEDPYGNFRLFEVISLLDSENKFVLSSYLKFKPLSEIDFVSYAALYDKLSYYIEGDTKNGKQVYYLDLKVNILFPDFSLKPDLAELEDSFKNYVLINGGYFSNVVAVAPYKNISTQIVKGATKIYPGLTTDFWKHGQAGLIDIADDIKPTKWYGKIHPFEFEFIVGDNPFELKIFDNLLMVANKAEPESFHFEVVGESYDFAHDKLNMFYRQELTKEMFQQIMYKDILFNRDYIKLPAPLIDKKSALLPLYYERVSKYDDIYDSYQQMTSDTLNYLNLSGGEIVWDKQLNEFKVAAHLKGLDISKVGRRRGNMQYKRDVWEVEIRPINFVEKNEDRIDKDKNPIPIPIVITRIPDYTAGDNPDDYPDGLEPKAPKKLAPIEIPYDDGFTDLLGKKHGVFLFDDGVTTELPARLSTWSGRKEVRFRDKYIKIKVRYSGKDLAVISALKTIYTNSYA